MFSFPPECCYALVYEQAYHQSLFRFTNDLADTQHFLVVNQGNSQPTHIDLLACDNNIHNTHTIIITPSFTTEPAASSFVNFTRSVCVLYPIANIVNICNARRVLFGNLEKLFQHSLAFLLRTSPACAGY